MKINTGKRVKPRRTMLYGVHGVGKSTWAAQAPNTVLLNLEDGLNDIDCASTDHLKDFDRVMDGLRWLGNGGHDFQNVAIDTVDWLEQLIHKEVAKEAGKPCIADIGYGAGYKQALAYWDRLTFALDWLRSECGMGVILLAHAEIKRFQSPETDSYDQYRPALHELASSTLQEWCDEVMFASYRVFVRTEDQGFNKERGIAVGSGERYLRTQETPAVMAKNRLSMPPEIPFEWSAYSQYFSKAPAPEVAPASAPPAGNLAGQIVEGSSKV